MAIDSTQAVRRAVMQLLNASSEVTAITTSIYGQQPPTDNKGERRVAWPFVLVGAIFGTPVRAACVDGVQLQGAVHGFAKARLDGRKIAETAEDHASRLGAAIARALDRQRVEIDGGMLTIRWTGPRLQTDGPDAMHTIQGFSYRCITG